MNTLKTKKMSIKPSYFLVIIATAVIMACFAFTQPSTTPSEIIVVASSPAEAKSKCDPYLQQGYRVKMAFSQNVAVSVMRNDDTKILKGDLFITLTK